MFIPEGYTEKEVLDIIARIVNILASKFRFGYLDIDDMKQEGTVFAIEGLTSYDPNKGYTLDNFLYIHVRNQFVNFKRNKYARYENPCKGCPFFDPQNLKSKNQCSAFVDKLECPKYSKYQSKTENKKKLLDTVELDGDSLPNQSDDVTTMAEFSELNELIDSRLPLSLRADYIRMLHKIKIPKNRRAKVREAILEILKESKSD